MKAPAGKNRAGAETAIRTMLAIGLVATLSGCAMVGMMGVMHGGMLGQGSSDSGGLGSPAESRQDGNGNHTPRNEPRN